jgi:uncharacterized protein YodC (DUF2158 family)
MANKERKFKIGDVVRLNSGGPDMTVESLVTGQVFVNCSYYEGVYQQKKQIHEGMVKSADLSQK